MLPHLAPRACRDAHHAALHPGLRLDASPLVGGDATSPKLR